MGFHVVTIGRENVEIAKDGAQTAGIYSISSQNVAGKGGTGIASQTGVSSASESGYAHPESNGSRLTDDSQDQTATANVRAALAKGFSVKTDDTTRPEYSKIEVATRDGMVTLRGTVCSDGEKQLIAKQVATMAGVRSVRNELVIAEKSNSNTAK
jgi:osmotically-inducible protein OsmY